MKKQLVISFILLVMVAILVTACSSTPPAVAPSSGSGLDGKALVESRCTECHSINRIQQKKPASSWPGIVDNMIGRGAKLNADEKAAVLKYLTTTYGQ